MAIIFKHCRGYFHKYILITMMEIPALLVASLEVQTRLGDIHKYLFKYITYNVFKGSVL